MNHQWNNEHDACGIGAIVHIDGRKDHQLIDQALQIVEKLEHRAGKDATGQVGDGVGILSQLPHRFFWREARKLDIHLNEEGSYAVAMLFLPEDTYQRRQAKKTWEKVLSDEGLPFLGWREVPIRKEILGQAARECMPYIAQCFVGRPAQIAVGLPFERRLYVARRVYEKICPEAYVVSFSSQTIVYKGMFLVGQLRAFFPDLSDSLFTSAIALVHSRFSTNTTPSWQRAHPNRMIAHNGEINTIRGNISRMLAREETLKSPYFKDELDKIYPIIHVNGSDSAMLDNTLEFLYMNGMDLAKAMMLLIPEPYQKVPMPKDKQDFYHYYATMMEPWDGPAAVLFSDGIRMGAALDRNGLRPSRYYVMDDQTLILSSEVGVLEIDEAHVLRKARLEPGKMLLVDTKCQELIEDAALKRSYANAHPYGEWLHQHLIQLNELPMGSFVRQPLVAKTRQRLYQLYDYTYEDVRDLILPMAANASEPIASMGTDVPLALFSDQHPNLFHYFKQQFAQVTNPPIDSLREAVVIDTTIFLGRSGNLLVDEGENCHVLELAGPILNEKQLAKIRQIDRPGLKSSVVSLLFYQGMSLAEAINELFRRCDQAINAGTNILILSDRGVDEHHLVIPSLLAVAGLDSHLVDTRMKTAVSVVLESGEPRDVHQCACLLGFGASAINPYLAHESIAELIEEGYLKMEFDDAVCAYDQALRQGVTKIAAKMGISCLQSYQSAKIFESVGLKQDLIETYFRHIPSQVGGIGIEDLEADVRYYHQKAFDPLGLPKDLTLKSKGFHRFRRGQEAEEHLYDPETIIMLQRATQMGDYELFKQYSKHLRKKHAFHLRSQFQLVSGRQPVALDEVEGEHEIVKRFKTGAMSYGSISKEAHECMAIAMNRLGGKSNSGEGGEDPQRFGTEKNSAIKQVASGRFGVTSAYLVSAREIQIKMAQGAKPGEGGHLPGQKVYPWIARTRYSTPGVTLISPPPHHDIYSIEDLAELIYDLKNANPQAQISVKLASESGVGTIASGVAKAGADVILISGYDGGTGAASQSAIHHTGMPWEIGIWEAQQSLVENGLRQHVRLETDGKLMTGYDVAVACLLGAEEFGFATAPLVSMGCMMMRVCNLDTCPVGIATQNEKLRARFKGKPEYVMNFMLFVARELREIMAELGYRSVDEMVGHVEDIQLTNHPRMTFASKDHLASHYEKGHTSHDVLSGTLDARELIPFFKDSLVHGMKKTKTVFISSLDRCLGTMLGSELTRQHPSGLPDHTMTIHCIGGAGQSFGAFLPKGITMDVQGDANDYFGKGLSGGILGIAPVQSAKYEASQNVIIGNVALYGATSGEAYIAGKAGERFAVRNSGATAVVEGVGDHALEYMTGGTVLILGPTGKNVAAGMSGGIAYVLDLKHDLYQRLNEQLVDMCVLQETRDIRQVKKILSKHIEMTDSWLARRILEDFDSYLPHFKKIIPRDYAKVLEMVEQFEKRGDSHDEARLNAFIAMHQGGEAHG
ncbi:MAG TPA: glutamate synthase large subunit [Candidatus Fimiplasma intestinipullorum]|uniref:Glutamate synthase large subunit n=1 Tax=Candidatus Fimiplasma intestinipullorum TaxID=2840825 RepID=A0A9D1L0Z2_9FIRM|nr:glutamate synthase large subunit [Candidatus Fimiplasma intestinipullorum]